MEYISPPGEIGGAGGGSEAAADTASSRSGPGDASSCRWTLSGGARSRNSMYFSSRCVCTISTIRPLAAASPAAVPWSPPAPPHSASQYDFFHTRRFGFSSRRFSKPKRGAHSIPSHIRRSVPVEKMPRYSPIRAPSAAGGLGGDRARGGGGERPGRLSSKELRRSLIRAAFLPAVRPASSTARPHSAATKASAHIASSVSVGNVARNSPKTGTPPSSRSSASGSGASSTTRRAGGGGGGSTLAGFAGSEYIERRAENFREAGAFPGVVPLSG